MATRFRRSIWLVRTMGVTMTWTLLLGGIEIRAAAPSFCAAYIHPGDDGPLLTLFPMVGPKVTVPLPAGLPRDFRLMATSLDGKAIYGQASDQVGPSDAIIKIDFKPTRHSLVQGSVGLGTIWYLSISQQSDRIFASGWSKRQGMAECGAFEIDTGTLRNLRVGLHPDCGGAAGDISPDGKRVLGHQGNRLSLLDLETGAGNAFDTDLKDGVWSQDGRWIAATSDTNRIVLIDATNTSRRRDLGPSGGTPVHWSPDSKYLLLSKSQLRCTLDLYFDSLQTLDVKTGKRSVIKSSRCEVGSGNVGWLDMEAVR